MKKIFVILVLAVMGVMTVKAQAYGDGAVEQKFEIRLDFDYMTGLKTVTPKDVNVHFGNGITRAEEGGMVTLGFGYNITGNWYVGVASGIVRNIACIKNHYIPVLADVAYRYHFNSAPSWALGAEVRAGYLVSAYKTKEVKGEMVNYPGAFLMDVMPVVTLQAIPSLDVKFGVGYTFFHPGQNEKMDNASYMTFKLGLGYRF